MLTVVLCRTQQGPSPEQVADALRQKGYSSFVEVEDGNLIHSLSAEIRCTLGRMPIVVNFYHDLIDYPDEGDSDYWEWMEELLPNAKDREGIRRFILVSGMDNVDMGAFQVVLDYLQGETEATVITQKQSEAQ